MPVWEKRCPKCGRPIDLDTESSKMYCNYCNTQFWTDEFIHERTPYHKKEEKRSDFLDAFLAVDSKNDSFSDDGYARYDNSDPSCGFVEKNAKSNQKLWEIKPDESWFFGGCRNLAFFSFALALSGTSLGAIGTLLCWFLGFLLVLIFALPACLSFLEVALNKKYKQKIGPLRVGTLASTIVFVAVIATVALCINAFYQPAYCGSYLPTQTLDRIGTAEETNYDLKGQIHLDVDKDGYVLEYSFELPNQMQKTISGSYTEKNGLLAFDNPSLEMRSNKKVYATIDLTQYGHGFLIIELEL